MNIFIAWLMFLVILWSSLIGCWWYQRAYFHRMIRLGIDVVLEAQRVADEYPGEYADYRLRAERALDNHAVGVLAELLPIVKRA